MDTLLVVFNYFHICSACFMFFSFDIDSVRLRCCCCCYWDKVIIVFYFLCELCMFFFFLYNMYFSTTIWSKMYRILSPLHLLRQLLERMIGEMWGTFSWRELVSLEVLSAILNVSWNGYTIILNDKKHYKLPIRRCTSVAMFLVAEQKPHFHPIPFLVCSFAFMFNVVVSSCLFVVWVLL